MKELARLLVHDVGKQITRVARNVSNEVPPGLLGMLCADLYALRGVHGTERASARFDRLVGETRHVRLDEARAALASLDALEPRVRAAEVGALAEAVALARGVETSIAAWLDEVSGG